MLGCAAYLAKVMVLMIFCRYGDAAFEDLVVRTF